MDDEYKYDVAFSFLAGDENIAMKLHGLVKDSVKSFIYSEEQKYLAGNDGEVAFNKIFNKESRTVVILYRAGWGLTSWTRIEEEAIRNRALEEGYDFTLWIALQDPANLPQYVPKTRLYGNLERWGLEAIGSVIEERVTSFGGNVQPLTNAVRLQRATNDVKRQAKVKEMQSGGTGVESSLSEFNALLTVVKEEVSKMKQASPDWSLNVRDRNNGVDVLSYNYQLTFQASYFHSEPHIVSINTWKGIFMPDGYAPANPQGLSAHKYIITINSQDRLGWTNASNKKGFATTHALVEETIAMFLKTVTDARLKSG